MFNRNNLVIKPLADRINDLDISIIKNLNDGEINDIDEKIIEISKRIISAKTSGASVIFMMGAHVIRSGVQNYIIDLIKRGYLSCIAMNGAGIIHDFEFALTGCTTESVAKYIKEGQFGLWKETAYINDIINENYKKDKNTGMGEAIGKYIETFNFPYKDISILAQAYNFHIPVTVHVGIGYDIIHEHPNCDGAATGALSYNDFLTFVSVVQGLENGVVMNFGSSVMAPEIYLKALSMSRNIANQKGKEIKHFSTLVCDLIKLPEDIKIEPSKDDSAYYFRPLKTMLIRTVADGGESFYVKGRHSETIPSLWAGINKEEKNTEHKTI
jgi:hypothetical protein